MGRIRSALRAYALEFPGPADVLGKLDRKMQYFEENAIMATVCYAVLDPGSGQLAISSAGHLPPVIAAPGQHGAIAEIAADLPIGVTSPFGRQFTTLTLVPGAVLCLYTDGLVERQGTSTSMTASPACARRWHQAARGRLRHGHANTGRAPVSRG